jgi:AcrR family transcriptional regulator
MSEVALAGPPIDKRERILAAAGSLFSQNDYASVPMDDIASEAGVAKGTLYNYFGSKDTLYCEYITARLEQLITILRETSSRGRSPFHAMSTAVTTVVTFMLKDPAFFLIWKREEGRAVHGARQPWSSLRDQLHAAVAETLEHSGGDAYREANDSAIAASFILSAADCMVFRNISRQPDDPQIVSEREILIEFISRALAIEAHR